VQLIEKGWALFLAAGDFEGTNILENQASGTSKVVLEMPTWVLALYVVLVLLKTFANAFLPAICNRHPGVAVPECWIGQRVDGVAATRGLQITRSSRLYKSKNKAFGGASGRPNGGKLDSTRLGDNLGGDLLELYETTEVTHVCDDVFKGMSQRLGGLGSCGDCSEEAIIKQRFFLLSENIDDDMVESKVDLKPNGEIVFLETHGGPSCKSIHGSWFVTPGDSFVRLCVDRVILGKNTEFNVRSHYSGVAQSSLTGATSFSSASEYESESGGAKGEICDDGGCGFGGAALGWFSLNGIKG